MSIFLHSYPIVLIVSSFILWVSLWRLVLREITGRPTFFNILTSAGQYLGFQFLVSVFYLSGVFYYTVNDHFMHTLHQHYTNHHCPFSSPNVSNAPVSVFHPLLISVDEHSIAIAFGIHYFCTLYLHIHIRERLFYNSSFIFDWFCLTWISFGLIHMPENCTILSVPRAV